MKKKTIQSYVILLVILCIANSFISTTEINSQSLEHPKSDLSTNATNDLRVFSFSHLERPIYVNYSVLNFTVFFEGPESLTADVKGHYSNDQTNWESFTFVKTAMIADYTAAHVGLIGPLNESGEYYLKINATKFSNEYAASYYRFIVEPITGIIFVDFSYNVKTLSDESQYADIFVNILGSDIKSGTPLVKSNQEEDTLGPISLSKVAGSNTTYSATLGPINDWEELVQLTFSARTSADVNYSNSNFYFYKAIVYPPEDFWRVRFPSIAIAVFVIGSVAVFFIIARRKPPRKFEQ